MDSNEPYRGPVALSASKHASPPIKMARFPPFPSVSPLKAAIANGGAIATKEQMAIESTKASLNADAQLALAQNDSLREQIEEHSTKMSKSVSSAVSNTRQLLTLLRDSIRKESPASADADLKTVDTLWLEMEKLFEAAQSAGAALPEFLEKQKDNMSLYHTSMVNEAFCNTNEELTLQHKKVKLQHSLILDHQQAFQDYKANIDPKLKEFSNLQDRVSCLTLEKAQIRGELEEAEQHLEHSKLDKDKDAKKIEELQKEVEMLVSKKHEIVADTEVLRRTIDELNDKVKAAEKKATDYYEKEIYRVGDQYAKERQKAAALDTLVKALNSGESEAKKEVEKLKAELGVSQEKYKQQSIEYSKIFSDFKDQNKKIDTLITDTENLRKQNSNLNERLDKLAKLETEAIELGHAKAELQRTVGSLKKSFEGVKEEAETLSKQLEAVQKENEELEMENNDLLARATEHRKISAASSTLKAENDKLHATIQGLQKGPSSVIRNNGDDEVKALKEKLHALEEAQASTEEKLKGWAKLASDSYKQYKAIVPVYNEAEKYRQENEQLKEQLGVRAGGSSSAADGDAIYWRTKYETLLASLE